MRLFQNSGIYLGYKPKLEKLTRDCQSFTQARDLFLNDRYGACHFLQPVLEGHPEAFFTNGDDESLQRRWANENGLPASTSLDNILLSQIESHKAEVFYNLDPMRYGSSFVRRLPSCVKASIAWRAAPSPGADFVAYDRVVCNFPSILRAYEALGWKTAYLSPAHDPEMDAYAANKDRPVDVLFVGGYTRHHAQRAVILEAVAKLRDRYRLAFHLDRSRATRWAESPLGQIIPTLVKYRRPVDIQAVSQAPVYGRDLYKAISNAKIVLNGAIDMAGNERGNMRCFEAMGCGALMVSDRGIYPSGMSNGQTILTYENSVDAALVIERTLLNYSNTVKITHSALSLVRERYSKDNQFLDFIKILEFVK